MPPALPAHVAAVVADFRRQLTARFGPDLIDVRVFGSAARGEMHEESDVDVFVLLREAGLPERRVVLDLAGDLWASSGLFLSPTIFDAARFAEWKRQERALVMDIERDGIPA